MLKAVVASPELPILDVTHEVLSKQRVPLPKAIRKVDSSTEATLLGAGKSSNRAPYHRAVDIESQHEFWSEASSETSEIISAVCPDEVRDDVTSSPVATNELAVIERHRGSPRVFEPAV